MCPLDAGYRTENINDLKNTHTILPTWYLDFRKGDGQSYAKQEKG